MENFCGLSNVPRMRRFFFGLIFLLAGSILQAQVSAIDLEKEIAAVVAGPQVTVIHFWAPWCPNCKAEMNPEGWAKFIGDNAKVRFVFINVWHKNEDPAPKL